MRVCTRKQASEGDMRDEEREKGGGERDLAPG